MKSSRPEVLSKALLVIARLVCVSIPAKQEVADSEPQQKREAKPEVKGHENQHETIGKSRMQQVEHRLRKMAAAGNT
ncbi:hypothetical protein ElyMa_001214800 [Elysia marginata]|uniref:Secreted protein n=1 Tax=Elysia marginata TaxID=1093978 RepID=A0AAV4IAF2_9GAST|nr:hypothetical protein ElyMa_001214800 [Elysia marginata]